MNKAIYSVLAGFLICGTATTGKAEQVTNQTPLALSSSNQNTPLKTYHYATYTKLTNETDSTLILEERVESLSSRLSSTEFSSLSFIEKLTLLKDFYLSQIELFREYQSQLLMPSATIDLEDTYEKIKKQDAIYKRHLKLVEDISYSYSGQNEVSKLKHRPVLKSTLNTLKLSQETGRDLMVSFQRKQEAVRASQILTLQQQFTESLNNNQRKDAIDSLAKIVKLSGGDKDYLRFLSELVGEPKNYVMFNNDLIYLKHPLMQKGDKWFISVVDLRRSFSINVEERENLGGLHIPYQEQEIEINDNQVNLNKETIFQSNEISILDSGVQYLNLEFLSELMGYQVKLPKEHQLLTIEDALFDDLDFTAFTLDEIISTMKL